MSNLPPLDDQEQESAQDHPLESEAPPRPKWLIPLVLVGVLLIVVIGVGAYFLIQGKNHVNARATVTEPAPTTEVEPQPVSLEPPVPAFPINAPGAQPTSLQSLTVDPPKPMALAEVQPAVGSANTPGAPFPSQPGVEVPATPEFAVPPVGTADSQDILLLREIRDGIREQTDVATANSQHMAQLAELMQTLVAVSTAQQQAINQLTAELAEIQKSAAAKPAPVAQRKTKPVKSAAVNRSLRPPFSTSSIRRLGGAEFVSITMNGNRKTLYVGDSSDGWMLEQIDVLGNSVVYVSQRTGDRVQEKL